MTLKLNINYFFIIIKNKKKYKKILNNYFFKKRIIKNYKNLKFYFIKFTISLTIKKSNLFIYILNCTNKKKQFYSAKSLINKNKNLKLNNFENFYKIIITKFKFLKNKPLAIHFNSLELHYNWFLVKLSKKYFLTILKFFNKYAHNGCRIKKKRNG